MEKELLDLNLLKSLNKLIDKTIDSVDKDNGEYTQEQKMLLNNIYSIILEVGSSHSLEEKRDLLDKINMKLSSFEVSRIRDYLTKNSEFNMFRDDIESFIESIEKKSLLNEDRESDTHSPIVIESTSVSIETNDLEEGKTQRLLKIIDDKIAALEKEALENEKEKEVNYFQDTKNDIERATDEDLDNLFNPFNIRDEENKDLVVNEIQEEKFEKLSRDEIDGFLKKIDDKLAELEEAEKSLDVTRFDLPTNEEE